MASNTITSIMFLVILKSTCVFTKMYSNKLIYKLSRTVWLISSALGSDLAPISTFFSTGFVSPAATETSTASFEVAVLLLSLVLRDSVTVLGDLKFQIYQQNKELHPNKHCTNKNKSFNGCTKGCLDC